ncbi:hypothetical protein [Microvirga massiliensis]|uniref:hypothetical protein n=1 Tax=Microvirga massiliensis TaxID=1033741 RepID=UPI0006602BC4|nr:hypothetical protein [Microvirga massiliensis]
MIPVNLARFILIAGLTCGINGALGPQASAQEATHRPHVPLAKTIGQPSRSETGTIPSLAVINADGARLEGNQLTLTGVSSNAIVFADRPVRAAGHVTTADLVSEWAGNGSFAKDPPNATVSVLGGGSNVSDAVVTLKSAKTEGSNLIFDVAILEGNLGAATGPAALFIDHWGWHGRGAWYAGAAFLGAAAAAAGAAAASPYYYPPPPAYSYGYNPYPYPPRCGYYPYPPCY